MPADEFLAEIKRHVIKLEADKVAATKQLDEAKANLRSINSRLSTWNAALSDYEHNGKLTQPVNADYTTLTPKERVDLWASEHSGILVVADLALVLEAAGVKKNYRSAYASVRASVFKRKDFELAEPGVYRRLAGS